MAEFAYTGRSTEGRLVRASMDAASAEAVASRLVEDGIVPIKIAARQATAAESPLQDVLDRLTRRPAKLEHLTAFARQMYTLSRAGMPIIRGIDLIAGTTRSPMLNEALVDVAESLRAGRELSASLQRRSDVFSPLFVSMVQVGEATGKLDEAFQQISSYLELERETQKRIKSAMRYPVLVIGAIVAAIILINLFVIPAFNQVFESLGADLPWATRLLIQSSEITVTYWPLMIAAAIGCVVGFRYWVATVSGRREWDRRKLRFPLTGSIVLRATLGRYARAFAMSFGAGLPVPQTLEIVARAADNAWVAEGIAAMRASIERGETMTRSAIACGLFTPMVVEMMTIGEESGALAELHEEIADSYEREVDYDLKRLTDMIEPLMIVMVGGIVLLLALGVYLPMWDLAAAHKGGG